LEYPFVHADMPEHPIVADVIETPLNVAFQHPFRRVPSHQRDKALLDGVGSGAFWPEAVGIGGRRGLGNGFQS
jgi:hypothetical protein